MTLSLILFFCDYRFHCFSVLRDKLSPVLMSIQYVVNRPSELVHDVAVNFVSKQVTLEDNARLSSKLLLINTKLQRLSYLEHENAELRLLLNYSRQIKGEILPAELITSATDNFTQQITIDRGKHQGVYIGQPVLDAYGLFGQVVMVEPDMSTVMLITNSKSAVPVMVIRSGLQAIAFGMGHCDCLELANVPETADVKVGDSLVTSGLGRIFPPGYQVGTVREIKRVLGERFMKVLISPNAHINKSLHVFLVWLAAANKNKI
jgi:rod shape-determining protein MreC